MLKTITELSRRYGSDSAYTLAGGGNTSCKDEQFLYVKPSGVTLANIKEDDFIKMDRSILRECLTWGEFADKDEREERVKKLMEYSVIVGNRRPSVEAPLHELMEFKYIVHMHPALVNGMTCGRDGKKICARLFPDALWVDYCDPGFTLAKQVYEDNKKFKSARGFAPKVIMMQNHGVFVGADSAEEVDRLYNDIMSKLKAHCEAQGVATELKKSETPDNDTVNEYAPLMRGWLGSKTNATISACGSFTIPTGPLTPDHLVYAKAFGIISDKPSFDEIQSFQKKRNYLPRMIEIPGKAVFSAGKDRKAADTVRQLAENGALVEQLTAAFGGVNFLTDAQREFIENWEVESYRASVAAGANTAMTGMVAVVTGGAQGFGYGIAKYLAEAGADVVIADLNVDGAKKAASELGAGASGFGVNIANEDSVKKLFEEITVAYGGVDLLVANAGVLKAGSVKDFQLKDWEFVTDVNYNGYFLCVKHCARLMAKQNKVTNRWTDIVQVNSKSGLEGSRSNGAYAGSKFGTIGLTQSFALELVVDKIKVNSVCPGNFFDGPLWSDPEKGLFTQYLETNKVPGAKTIEDVKKHYEGLIPMHRGCFPEDVAKAIIYAVTQQYETGQAIPVTGGQVMLN